MDPNETLRNLRERARNWPDDLWAQWFTALDEWLSKGGFLPKDWEESVHSTYVEKL